MSALAVRGKQALAQNARPLLVLAGLCWFALLCFVASLTPNAFVFADETGYFLPILFGSNAENYQRWSILGAYPSYLYFWLYSLLPAGSLHDASKFLNAGFIAATAIPAYALARRTLSIPFAAAFGLVVMLSPISSFVRYVMPEPMYVFGFWLVIWVVVSALDRSPLLAAAAGGVSIGVLSLVKPHAVALALGIAAFLVLRERWRIRGAVAAAVLCLGYYAVRVGGSWILTGESKWSISGLAYDGLMLGLHIDWSAAAFSLAGHASAIAALIAVPVAVTVIAIVRQAFAPTARPGDRAVARLLDLGLMSCCILAALIAMVVYFAQSIYQLDPEIERITRLSGRHYVFVLPLFLLVTIGLWQNRIALSDLLSRRATLLLCGAMIAAAAVLFLKYETSSVDYPDLTLSRRGLILGAMVVLFAALAVSRYGRALATSHLILGATLWWVAVAVATSARLIVVAPFTNTFSPQGPVDTAFFAAADRNALRGLVGRNDGIIVGAPGSAVEVFRAMFYLRSLSAGRIVASGAELKDDDLKGVHWAVLLPGLHYTGASRVTQFGALSIVWRQ